MLSIIKSMSLHGLEGKIINVEIDVSSGLPNWCIVGLPDASVRESKERVTTAIKNSGYEFKSRKIIVNLSPANTRKEGSVFDLSIAIGLLINFGYIKKQVLIHTLFIGELSLDGKINEVRGILPMCIEAKKLGINNVFVPKENAEEASIVEDINVIGVESLKQVERYLNGTEEIKVTIGDAKKFFTKAQKYKMDYSEVRGQEQIKRALEVAAARRA